jgi:DNA-binding transcriptional MerR regulator
MFPPLGQPSSGWSSVPKKAGTARTALDLERARSRTVVDVTTLSISDAAEQAGVSAHTLRYYERAGLLDSVARADSGHRRFDDADLARVEFIARLRATGMPIRDVRRYVDLVRAGEHTEPERLALLEAHGDRVRAHLAEVERSLERIQFKIDLYRERTRS